MTQNQNDKLLRSAIIIAERHLKCKSDTAKIASKRALKTLCGNNMIMYAAAMTIAQQKFNSN